MLWWLLSLRATSATLTIVSNNAGTGERGLSLLFQVAPNGDLANWKVPNAQGVGNVGGAMDLVAGAKCVIVMMRHIDKSGRPKLVERCTFPLTALGCVSTVFTDMV